jgi:hypothetical protein
MQSFFLVIQLAHYIPFAPNLTNMATTLHSIINYGPLKILKVYIYVCFEHVMSKACQYATNDDKIFI